MAKAAKLHPLHAAARDGDVEAIRNLIMKGVLPSKADARGMTALHYASQGGKSLSVTILAQQGARLGAVDADGRTPLYMAAELGARSVVQALLEGAGVTLAASALHSRGRGGKTTLVSSTSQTSSTAIAGTDRRLAVVKGADDLKHIAYDARHHASGRTALFAAARGGHAGVVEDLLIAGADPEVPDANGTTALYAACARRHLDTVKVMIHSDRVDLGWKSAPADGSPAQIMTLHALSLATLLAARMKGSVEEALDLGSPLCVAAAAGRVDICRAIVSNLVRARGLPQALGGGGGGGGKGRRRRGSSGSFAEARPEQDDEGGADENREDCTRTLLVRDGVGWWVVCVCVVCVCVCCTLHSFTKLYKSLPHPPPPVQEELDAPRSDGTTALWAAASRGCWDVVELLCDAGADYDKARKDDTTPMMAAVTAGHVHVVEMLLRAGANPNIARLVPDVAEDDGQTPLHIACRNGYLNSIVQLLRCGAQMNYCDRLGYASPEHLYNIQCSEIFTLRNGKLPSET